MQMGEDYFFYVSQDLSCKVHYPMRQDFEILKLLKRSKLKKKFNKKRNVKNWFNYKQQQIF